MKVYYPHSAATATGDLVDISDKQSRISSYFIWNEGDGKFLKFTKPQGNAQALLTEDEIRFSDYLNCNMSIPIFSKRACGILQREIPEEMEFHDLTVVKNNQRFDFAICKCLKDLELVNRSASTYTTFTDGTPALSKPVLNAVYDKNFFIARDSIERQIFAVSQKFVDICKKNNLHIFFLEAPQG